MSTWSWLLSLLILLLSTAAPLQAAPPGAPARARVQLPAGEGLGKGPLRLSAGKLRLDAKERRLELSRGVKVRLGKLSLRSETLTATLASRKGGKVKELRARGKVEVRLGKSRGHAATARILPASGVLELTGKPSLAWAPMGLTLRGRSIRLDLRNGMLTVEEALVSLPGQEQPRPGGEQKGGAR